MRKSTLIVTLLSTTIAFSAFSSSHGNNGQDHAAHHGGQAVQNQDQMAQNQGQMMGNKKGMRGNKGGMMNGGKGGMMQDGMMQNCMMQGGMMQGEVTAETLQEFMGAHLAQNPNLKMTEVTEKDGMFHFNIVTKDDSLVKEVVVDPKNPRGSMRGMMMMGGMMNGNMSAENMPMANADANKE